MLLDPAERDIFTAANDRINRRQRPQFIAKGECSIQRALEPQRAGARAKLLASFVPLRGCRITRNLAPAQGEI
jgi:hypothetical protein